MSPIPGAHTGPLSSLNTDGTPRIIDQDELDYKREQAENSTKLKQMRNTVGKLFRDFHSRIRQRDLDIVQEFEKDPTHFIDLSIDL